MSETPRTFVLGKVTLIRPNNSAAWANIEIPMVAVNTLTDRELHDRYLLPASLAAIQQLKEPT